MSFSQSAISDPQVSRDGVDMVVSWSSSAPAGTVHQVYVNRILAWHGTASRARLPWPASLSFVDIGTVDDGVGRTNYASSLTSGSANRANLTWLGGTYLSPNIDHYAIYSGTTPGGSVSFTAPVGTVPAYIGPVITDGYGVGGYGGGGYGAAASSYSWTSRPLAPGVWSFAVVPVDIAGLATGSPSTTTVTIVGPPNPPAPFADGTRLAYSLNPTTHVPVLSWLASP